MNVHSLSTPTRTRVRFSHPSFGAAHFLFRRRAAAVATALWAVLGGSMLRPAIGRWLQELRECFLKISCPTLLPRRVATWPAQVALAPPHHRMGLGSVAR